MKTFHIVLGSIAIIVLLSFIAAIVLPPFVYDQDMLMETLFTIVAVPLFTLNFWAWVYPEVIEFCFSGRELKTEQKSNKLS